MPPWGQVRRARGLLAAGLLVSTLEAQDMSTMPGGALAVWQMGDTGDSAGPHGLAVHGAVELGVRLDGPDREASLRRGGDGLAAHFAGGYLGLANDADFALTVPDPDHSATEDRWLDIGISAKWRLLVVYYTERQQNIRIIGCCKATRTERTGYEDQTTH